MGEEQKMPLNQKIFLAGCATLGCSLTTIAAALAIGNSGNNMPILPTLASLDLGQQNPIVDTSPTATMTEIILREGIQLSSTPVTNITLSATQTEVSKVPEAATNTPNALQTAIPPTMQSIGQSPVTVVSTDITQLGMATIEPTEVLGKDIEIVSKQIPVSLGFERIEDGYIIKLNFNPNSALTVSDLALFSVRCYGTQDTSIELLPDNPFLGGFSSPIFGTYREDGRLYTEKLSDENIKGESIEIAGRPVNAGDNVVDIFAALIGGETVDVKSLNNTPLFAVRGGAVCAIKLVYMPDSETAKYLVPEGSIIDDSFRFDTRILDMKGVSGTEQ